MEDFRLDLNKVLEWKRIEHKGLQPLIHISTECDGGYSLLLKISPQQMIDALTEQGYVVWTPEDLKDEDKD